MESKAKEMLTRGTGKFINCTDYDDAIKAMEEYKNSCLQEAIKKVEELLPNDLLKRNVLEILKSQING